MGLSYLSEIDFDCSPPLDAAGAVPAATVNGGSAGVFRIALTQASVAAIIPNFWRGRFVDFQCQGGTGLYILFGSDAGAVLVTPSTTVSTIASNVITFVTGTGFRIEAGVTKSYRVPLDPAITRFAWWGDTAAGYIAATLSTGRGTLPTTSV